MPSRSFSHAPATSSTTAAGGPQTTRPAFWSQADVSQSAASAAGTRAADHEAEVAPARDRDDARLGRGRELLDHVERIDRRVRQRPAECLAQLVDGRRRPDRPLVERLEEVGCDVGGSPEELALVAHPAESSFGRPVSTMPDEREHVVSGRVDRVAPADRAPRALAEVAPAERLRASPDRPERVLGRHDERRDPAALRAVRPSLATAQLGEERRSVRREDLAPLVRKLFPRAEHLAHHGLADAVRRRSPRSRAAPRTTRRTSASSPIGPASSNATPRPTRVRERQIESDRAAVAPADQDRRLRLELAQQRERVVGMLLHARRRRRDRAFASVAPAAVVRDAPVRGRRAARRRPPRRRPSSRPRGYPGSACRYPRSS